MNAGICRVRDLKKRKGDLKCKEVKYEIRKKKTLLCFPEFLHEVFNLGMLRV